MITEAGRSCRVVSAGAYRPTPVDSLVAAEQLGVDREWIVSRTGVETRGVAGPAESVVAMAVLAAQDALSAAGVSADTVDAVLVATSTNPQLCPAIAPQVAEALGLRVAAFDINIACSGFCYTLHVARSLIVAGSCDTVLVIGADRMLDMVNPSDRATAPVFADGAGAVLVSVTDGPSGIGPVVWGSSGDRAAALEMRPTMFEANNNSSVRAELKMDGLAVTRWACSTVPAVVREVLSVTGIGWDDVAMFVPHQANWKLIQRIARSLDLPEKVAVADDVRLAGNTSSASVPLALHRLLSTEHAGSGQWAVLVGFGSGLAYAGQAIRIP
ncbi:3-oxoacyl-[acyl-carrier-protein] synthase 3 protein 1 [Streptomyces inusitatus]|uniref:3-oxoacyl-[acyl-carrier-protein] synthase 3 protein 1 n=1 Tax=Streptomyces inusitatus TaxID=68221 RepID=A0A918PVL0_9ACTN|nr:beta-ketoacyl-ACP synthase 3 [Streptomyces inusitatus]GGZ24437.1 3-oxoacyl-[acyl-carrier-protein] synthase 3 protein 1 [Streptomyces inusitatus]